MAVLILLIILFMVGMIWMGSSAASSVPKKQDDNLRFPQEDLYPIHNQSFSQNGLFSTSSSLETTDFLSSSIDNFHTAYEGHGTLSSVNPATGLPMMNDVLDIGGNIFGTSHNDMFNNSFSGVGSLNHTHDPFCSSGSSMFSNSLHDPFCSSGSNMFGSSGSDMFSSSFNDHFSSHNDF